MAREERAQDPEQSLIEAAQANPGRFAELYERHFERVYAFIAARVRDRGEAEDLTAEVFHRALANLGRFEWRGTPFAAWLYRIAHNAIAGRRAQMPSASAFADPVDPSAPPEAEIVEVERRAQLFQSVHELPADQRRV